MKAIGDGIFTVLTDITQSSPTDMTAVVYLVRLLQLNHLGNCYFIVRIFLLPEMSVPLFPPMQVAPPLVSDSSILVLDLSSNLLYVVNNCTGIFSAK